MRPRAPTGHRPPRVVELSAPGTVLARYTTGHESHGDLAFDPAGNLWFTNTTSSMVHGEESVTELAP